MAESSNSGAWAAIGIVGGFFAGSLITYIVFRSRESEPPRTLQAQTSTMHPVDVDTLKQMWAEIQSLSKRVQSLSDENSALKIQLAAAREVKPPVIEAAKIPPMTTTAYKNNEKRVYVRGKDGFITSIDIIRDAKVNAAG